ncbi:DeoR/GlpR family DNA-binding transcription regulator [Acetobacter peroxydans]|jgi:DeoR family glycerol-3-phosphate regulon repressor|uniref:DeoR/GlpR family DNA-binding transcription regulator n=1 Tax=Acetobacter peroxydans TaxID=104098 RepID=UPI0023536E21|nr:DeoR/GlpR family DNA-binding transcription regulator [Acetobacter peroxydans]MCH4143836.1 DeoR/GlpR family DNA-binding transcription regulator [Acetobacter peroxydans]MCI1395034.1 DeoR/GlpR family DNA-binding transcription regulator [Acetobacter peroxydans]MCI1411365.1 DeoR/GlpR family DNA-binding transcription regulator [Acetobacter peroxydans]MCI1566462.1 DeoR/GlpR family DNA-binding transcription regulator [Acetobacter peroxydans]MCI1618677.1 DeoR/GlpR family DNA-binding transcription re
MSLKRQNAIMQAVRARGTCSITDLAAELDVSTETIRRNIPPLLATGVLARFHGGVMLPEGREEPPFQRRMHINYAAKKTVAACVRAHIQDGDSLILDNGTTSAYVAEALQNHSNLTVITHSVQIAYRLSARNGNRVFMAGGELSGEDGTATGPSVISFIRQFQVRYAILSVAGIGLDGEFGNFHLFEADFAQAALQQAQEAWIIADESKFGREAPVKVCQLGAVDAIVTSAPPPEPFAARCVEEGVLVLLPEQEGVAAPRRGG